MKQKLTWNLDNLFNSVNRDIDMGMITVDSEEIKLTPSNIYKYLSSRNREIRKVTYLSVNCAYKEKNKEFAIMLNDIYKKVL